MPFSRSAALPFLFAALIVSLLCATSARAQGRYRNLVNSRFSTVSSGPQSSVIVDVAAAADDTTVTAAVRKRVRADWSARARALAPQVAQASRIGLLKGRAVLPVSTIVTVRKNGRLVVPTAQKTRQVGGGELTFSYTGFTDAETSFLRGFQAQAYPLIKNIYGAPSWTGNVEVVNMGTLDDGQFTQVQRLAFGAYDASRGRILLPIYASPESEAHAFLLLMVHAFHGPAVLQYDAWEQGFARATAAIIAPSLGFVDSTANGLYSLLRTYDLLNQPPLANATFFPPSQKDVALDISSGVFSAGKMFLPRLGMSGAAFLKLYIENPAFFRNFNAAYYAGFNPSAQPSLAGNVPALRAIASDALRQGRADDSVEGLVFAQWFERQYVLDTSVALGEKLFAFVIPSDAGSEGDQSALIALVYFRTKADGDEELLGGRGYATYFDSSDARLSLGAASEQTPITDGEGFLTTVAFPTDFDAGRITMDFHVGDETARTYLPSGFTGDFQAVALGAQSGSVTVRQTTVPSVNTRSASGTVTNGGLGVTLGTGVNDLAVTVVDVTINNATTSYRFNTGGGQYYAVIRSGGSGDVQTVTQAFPAGLSLVTFPVRPLQTDISAALGLPASDFLLSFWDATRRGYETYGSGPTVAPIQLGRAYWLKLFPANGSSASNISVTGPAPPRDTDVTTALVFGWNLVGSPFAEGTAVDDLLVQYLNNDAIPWEDAVSRNLVAAQPFEFNTQAGAYAALPAGAGRLETWRGYYVRVLVPSGVTLIFPGPSAANRSVKRAAGRATPAPRPDWTVRLRARSEAGQIATAQLGVATGASAAFDNRYDLEAPPPILPVLGLEFPHTDWNGAGGRFVADYRSFSARRATWDLAATAPTDGPVTLSWDGLGTVPRGTRLSLVDKTAGTRTSFRNRSSYTFTAKTGESRAFQVVAEPERSAPFAITNVSIRRTRAVSSGLSVDYTLSDTADVTIEIGTIGGKSLRRLAGGGRAQVAGQRTAVWDGRTQDGAPVPAGPYTLTITARDENGAVARQTRPVLVLN